MYRLIAFEGVAYEADDAVAEVINKTGGHINGQVLQDGEPCVAIARDKEVAPNQCEGQQHDGGDKGEVFGVGEVVFPQDSLHGAVVHGGVHHVAQVELLAPQIDANEQERQGDNPEEPTWSRIPLDGGLRCVSHLQLMSEETPEAAETEIAAGEEGVVGTSHMDDRVNGVGRGDVWTWYGGMWHVNA